MPSPVLKELVECFLQPDEDCRLRPVAHYSRTLTPAKEKWAQIEKGNLASIWTCEKLEKYYFGLPSLELWTNDKSVEPHMMITDFYQAPVRCQRH